MRGERGEGKGRGGKGELLGTSIIENPRRGLLRGHVTDRRQARLPVERETCHKRPCKVKVYQRLYFYQNCSPLFFFSTTWSSVTTSPVFNYFQDTRALSPQCNLPPLSSCHHFIKKDHLSGVMKCYHKSHNINNKIKG